MGVGKLYSSCAVATSGRQKWKRRHLTKYQNIKRAVRLKMCGIAGIYRYRGEGEDVRHRSGHAHASRAARAGR